MAPLHGSRAVVQQEAADASSSASAADRAGSGSRSFLYFVLAGMLPGLVYLRTVAPTVYGLDSAELATGSYVLGIVHAPGSPTFLLLGHLFSWLPFGDVGYRVNLVSAASAAVACSFFCLVLLRLQRDPLLAMAGAWMLGFTYYFWVSALSAELYALHACFLAALLWLALCWRTEQRPSQLYAFALLFGLGLGNHLSLVLSAPGFALLLRREGSLALPSLRQLAVAFALAVLGASVYLYLPLRSDAPMNFARNFGVDVATWPGFVWMITGQMFSSQMLGVEPGDIPGELGWYGYRLLSNFIGIVGLLGVLGWIDDYRRRREVHWALAAIFLGHLAFTMGYDVGDKELMLVPTFVVWAIWVVLGVRALVGYVAAWTDGSASVPAGALVVLLAAGNLLLNFASVDLSGDRSARERGEELLQALPVGASYVGTWADVPILEYLQMVEGRRPDLDTLNVFFVQDRQRNGFVGRRLAAGREVFVSEAVRLPGMDVELIPVRDCGCYRVVKPG